ncbi:hypothetical protein C8J57DRAFT_1503314 [Mycena rebaudengoi]|nr:hypothetical protein C8J57DRAFT_1503314 [Mycena rebaudengoi]
MRLLRTTTGSLLATTAFLVCPALGVIQLYGQCGGDDIQWPDTCATGLDCVSLNYWFSQCLKATTTTAAGAEGTVVLPRATVEAFSPAGTAEAFVTAETAVKMLRFDRRG